jgi:alpha-beta hydrolase superfamily lysophospholipase
VVIAFALGLAGCAAGDSSTPVSTTVPAAASSVTSGATLKPSPPTSASRPSQVPGMPVGWVAEEVIVPTALGSIAGTWTHRADSPTAAPAALIIGGSGPTDRNGNSAADPAVIDNLEAVANWLADDGIATLRTDKPGSGKTGAGNLTPATAGGITVDDFVTMNAELLAFVAARPGVNTARLAVVGHSEGALFALLLAAGRHGAAPGVPPIHSLAVLEPQSLPILDILTAQMTAQVHAAETAGQLSATQRQSLLTALAATVAAVRAGTPLPADLPSQLAGLFAPTVLTYLRTDDAIDPLDIVASLPANTPIIVSCSDADIQVACSDVEQLAAAATSAGADVTLVHLTNVAHTLKVDPSRTTRDYGADLPFSPELRAALSRWASQ